MSNGDTIRLEWAGTIIGAIVILSFVTITVLASVGMASLSAIGGPWFAFYTILLLLASAQVFGPDTMKVVDRFRNGG